MKELDLYILDRHEPVRCESLPAWAEWMETADRCVAKEEIGHVTVSTIFLGLDHAFFDGPPMLFETMIFDGDDEYQVRCSTWEQAEKQHAEAVEIAQAGLNCWAEFVGHQQ